MLTDRIGKYRIIAKLGQGGMAKVFLTVVPGPAGFNKLLVVKELKEDLSQDPEFLAMFLNEARLAARLNHPNVVHTYEVGAEGDRHFIAMDYLEGQPLHAVLRRVTRASMPLDVHVRILADSLAGLHYAHTLADFDGTPLRVVHRDVSPQNVFVTYDGQVKLVDFGIAKAAGASTTTQEGVFKGKLSYVAPEQARGAAVDARADLFSIGVMLWEAMAGRRFAQGDAEAAVLARRLAGTEPLIRDVVPDCDGELAEICDRAMALDPVYRFSTAQEFRDALENFLDRFSRRAGSREVGELMGNLFREDREKIRQVIDEQMKRLMRETSQELPLAILDAHHAHSGHDRTPITTQSGLGRLNVTGPHRPDTYIHSNRGVPSVHHDTGNNGNGTLVAAHVSQRPPAKAPSNALPIAVGVLAFASVAGVLFSLWYKKPTEVTATTATISATATPTAEERIKLSITYGPPGAIAKLDGVPLSESPFIAQAARDGSMHQLTVEGPGMKPETKMLSYDKDISLSIALAEELLIDPRTSKPIVRVPGVRPGTSVATTPSADPPKRPDPPEDPVKPKNPKQPLEIDEQDPYKKK